MTRASAAGGFIVASGGRGKAALGGARFDALHCLPGDAEWLKAPVALQPAFSLVVPILAAAG
ncbi:MAG: hypothetical protein GWQ05_26965 [Verrucomicrobiaceae bacterium]|nr:hypothetical protein [Verrucomicrobiaceae bacterium]